MIDRPPPGWPDAQVIAAAQEGDAGALSQLVSASHPHVRRFAHSLCASPQDAEDAAQEALLVLYSKIGTLRFAAALASWMFKIVRHECIRRARVALRRPAVTDRFEPSAEEAALARIEVERLVECIAGLPIEQRQVLVMRDVLGLSGAATAESLGLERGAMKSRLHRARESVRSQLRDPAAGAVSRG